jgi:hypothetical protein
MQREPAARPFGRSLRDLEIDLADGDRPLLVSRLLAGLPALAGAADPESQAAGWAVDARLQGLLAIARATGTPPSWQTRCPACGSALELALDLAALAAPPREAPVGWTAPDGTVVASRLPSGADLALWRDSGEDEAALAGRLVETLDGVPPPAGWRLPESWLEPAATALAEADPLTVLQLAIACPDCRQESPIPFDLEGWLLRQLAAVQAGLIDEVHRLASAYHWSEAEIAALPPWRRRAYLARLDREDGGWA